LVPNKKTFKVVRELRGTKTIKWRFAKVLVTVIDNKGKGKMCRALLDSGCSKSLVLKKFTDKKLQSESTDEDCTVYKTHSGKFVSNSAASLAMRMVEFENNSNITIEHKFQVDKITDPKKSQYNMIIGSDLMWMEYGIGY